MLRGSELTDGKSFFMMALAVEENEMLDKFKNKNNSQYQGQKTSI